MKLKTKAPDKKKMHELKLKKKHITRPKKEKVVVVAAEIEFARSLSSNDKKTRDKNLKYMKKWVMKCFSNNYEFKQEDFERIWKGFFYAVWMSDKPLIQEELCDNIASILDLFAPEQLQAGMLMFRAGLKTLATEWYGIDQHRMDKFQMLVRRYLRGALRCVHRAGWSEDACEMFSKALIGGDGVLALKTPMYARNATSLMLHLTDCYLEEIAKVSGSDIPGDSLCKLLYPVCLYMCFGEVETLCFACRRVFTELVRQSEAGLEYRERHKAWQELGCPEGGPEALEPASDDEDDEDTAEADDNVDDGSEALDPRAGRVDVTLRPLPVPSEAVARMLRGVLSNTSSKAHRRAKICLQRFEKLSQNEYPLRIPEEDTNIQTQKSSKEDKMKSVQTLQSLEKRLVAASDELALRGLNRKHRKRLLARARTGASIVEEAAALHRSKNAVNGAWHVEEIGTKHSERKTGSSDKENLNKNKKRKFEIKLPDNYKKLKLDPKRQTNKVNNKKTNENKDSEMKKVASAEKQMNKKGKLKSESNKHSSNDISLKTSSKVNKQIRENNSPNSNEPKLKLVFVDTKTTDKPTAKVKKSPNQNLTKDIKTVKQPVVLVKKIKISPKSGINKPFKLKLGELDSKKSMDLSTPKKVQFVLKNNIMQKPVDYYKSVLLSPNIPFEPNKKPSKTNLKVSTPSPINPFFKKKLRMK